MLDIPSRFQSKRSCDAITIKKRPGLLQPPIPLPVGYMQFLQMGIKLVQLCIAFLQSLTRAISDFFT